MAKTLQFRRGTTSELSTQTGAEGEIFIDTTKDTVVVMDGSTPGGFPLATEASVTGDVVFDSVLIGNVSIIGNTIAGVDSYGNSDTLTVDGNLDVQGTFTVNGEPVSGGGTTYTEGTGINIVGDVISTALKTINGVALEGSGDIVIGGSVSSGTVTAGQNSINFVTTVTFGNETGIYPGGTSFLQFGVTSDPGVEPPTPEVLTAITTGATVQAYDESDALVTSTTATTFGTVFWLQGAGSFLIPVTWSNNSPYLGMSGGTKIEWTNTIAPGSSYDQDLNTTDDVVFNTALVGDVSIISNTISGVDSYGNPDTLVVDGGLTVTTSGTSSNTILYTDTLTGAGQLAWSENTSVVTITYAYENVLQLLRDLNPGDTFTLREYNINQDYTFTLVSMNESGFITELTVQEFNSSSAVAFGQNYLELNYTVNTLINPLQVTETGVNVNGTFTVNGEPVGGSGGTAYDQDLNTTDDVVFNTALLGDVSIVANTISAINSYGNSDSLILSGSAVNIIPESTTVTTTTVEWPNTSDALFTGTDVNIAGSPGGDLIGFYTILNQEFYNSLLALPIGTIITVAQPSGNTTVTLASQFIDQNPWNGSQAGVYANVVSLPVSGYSQGEVSGVTTNILTSTTETATFAFDPAGTFSTPSLMADSAFIGDALIGDVSIVGNQISGIDSYGNDDTLVVDGDLEVTGSLINDSTLTVNQDGSKSVVVNTTASTTTTLDMSGYGQLKWLLDNNDGRYYFLIPTSLYELYYGEYFVAGTVVTGFFDSAGKADPFTLTLDTNMVSKMISASMGYAARTVGSPPGFPPNSTNNIWTNEVTVTNTSGSITDYSFDDQGTFTAESLTTTSLLADSALIGDVSIVGNTIAAVDSYGAAADLAISATSVTFDQDLTLSVNTSVAVVATVNGGMNQFYVYGPMNGNVFSYNSMGSIWSDSSKFVTGSIVSVTDNMDGNVVVRLTSNMTYSMGAGGFTASYTVVSGGTNLNMGASYNASTVTVTNTTGSIANYSFDNQGTLTTTALLSDSALIGDVSIAGNTISAIDSYGINSPLTIDHGLTVTGLSTTGNIYTLVPDVDFDSNTRWSSSAGYGTFTIDFTNVNGGVATANLLAFIDQISSGTVITIPDVGDRVVENPPTLSSTSYNFTTVVDPFAQIYITGNIVLDQTVTSTVDVITVTDSGLNVNGTSTTTTLLADSALVGDVSIIGSTISGVDSYGLSDTLVVDGDLEVTGNLDIRSVSPSITDYFYVSSDGPIAWLGTFLTVDNPNPAILTLIQSLNVGDKLTFQDQMNAGTSVTVTLTSTMSFNGMSYIATVAENNSSGMSISPANGTLTVTSLITNTSSFDSTGINVSNVNAQLLTTESLTTTSLLADSALIGDVSIVGSTIAGVDSYGVAGDLILDGTVVYSGETTETPTNTASVNKWLKVGVQAMETIPGTEYTALDWGAANVLDWGGGTYQIVITNPTFSSTAWISLAAGDQIEIQIASQWYFVTLIEQAVEGGGQYIGNLVSLPVASDSSGVAVSAIRIGGGSQLTTTYYYTPLYQ
jgi:hypothetical protein